MMQAIYAGTFDPFTNGHLDIVRQARKLFEEVVIVFANNSSKKREYDINEMSFAVSDLLKQDSIKDRARVMIVNGLITDYARGIRCNYFIRGVRTVFDFMYEEEMANANELLLPEAKTIYLRPAPENRIISSSLVRELNKHGRDVSPYVPARIMEVILHDND